MNQRRLHATSLDHILDVNFETSIYFYCPCTKRNWRAFSIYTCNIGKKILSANIFEIAHCTITRVQLQTQGQNLETSQEKQHGSR
jgi:hypothetical protein